ncbi:hypothetical protein DPMN_002940 [Dreissena polymorpha]|uniref:Uncharacterized protein n=1 Tax=Dreissena polymorpha TaxID=45954 RepID=A0A9D4MNR7_DREPO|nr:hypothetical protein DPMN_002940 [Dreissena polymorpha]
MISRVTQAIRNRKLLHVRLTEEFCSTFGCARSSIDVPKFWMYARSTFQRYPFGES